MKRADHHLVQQVLDGDIDRDGFDDFQNRLRKESELVDLYTDYALLHHTLTRNSRVAGCSGAPQEIIVAAACRIPVHGWPWRRFSCSARPGGGRGNGWTAGSRQEVAVMTFSVDAVWQSGGGLAQSRRSDRREAGGSLHSAAWPGGHLAQARRDAR